MNLSVSCPYEIIVYFVLERKITFEVTQADRCDNFVIFDININDAVHATCTALR